MNCIDCSYNLLKDGHPNCTYEEGECIKISVLEKENAELNKKLSEAEADYDKMFWSKNEIISKAKEIIRMVIDSYNLKERFSFEKDLIKAEQFLKEE